MHKFITPRVGSDVVKMETVHNRQNFNPRSPCGERHRGDNSQQGFLKFQSTLPVWGATSK